MDNLKIGDFNWIGKTQYGLCFSQIGFVPSSEFYGNIQNIHYKYNGTVQFDNRIQHIFSEIFITLHTQKTI